MIEVREPSKAPIVLITGATGNLGRSIAEALADSYQIVGMDREADEDTAFPVVEADLTDGDAIAVALDEIRERRGSRLASVAHLAAFFDFSGENHPLYEKLNVEGTRMLLEALRDRFDVEQFVYASTMLVHEAGEPGERVDENQPIEPRWAYLKSKVKAEEAIRKGARGIHYVILRLAGVYDEKSMVPTLAHQIARIYERGVKSYFYSGSTEAGQSMVPPRGHGGRLSARSRPPR